MQQFQWIEGGVCAPGGFRAAGVHCGVRKNKDKRDLSLIVSDVPCAAAAVYTLNKVQGAPIAVTKRNLANGRAQAIVCNSGNANTCNADGEEKAWAMCSAVGQALHMDASDVIVASTGVIGQPLPLQPILQGVPALTAALSPQGSDAAAQGIMTTDTVKKEVAVRFLLDGVECRIGGIAKGSGMIHPNMATMLGFITTDVSIEPALLQAALSQCVGETFNMVSVDGDTSTNDMVCVLANGTAGNACIAQQTEAWHVFTQALNALCVQLCKAIAGDGEGASKLLECTVTGAPTLEDARTVAKSVITSSLFKAAMFGQDANWGRILCAIGYAPVAQLDIGKIGVVLASEYGSIEVCAGGSGMDFSEETAKTVLRAGEINIAVALNQGEGTATAWGCDLTYDYVKINGDYRT